MRVPGAGSPSAGDPAVREFDARRRRAVVGGMAAGAAAWSGAVLFYVLLRSLGPGGPVRDLVTLLAQSLYVGAPIVGYVVYRELASPRRLVVWLRRFRPAYGDRIRFHRALARACGALATPVTIQDRSFAASVFSAALRGWLLFPLLGFGWVMGLLLAAFAAPSSAAALGLTLAAWTGVSAWAVWRLLRRLGYRALGGPAGVREAGRRFARLREGRGGPGAGVEVLRCDDGIWKDVVAEALSRADLAIIDVSDPTENVLWELAQSRTCLDEGAILLVCEAGQAESALARLRRAGGALPGPAGGAVLTYPDVQEPAGRGRARQYAELADRLRHEIASRTARR